MNEDFNISPLIVTNYNGDKIRVTSVFDEKFKLWRVGVKLKKVRKKKNG